MGAECAPCAPCALCALCICCVHCVRCVRFVRCVRCVRCVLWHVACGLWPVGLWAVGYESCAVWAVSDVCCIDCVCCVMCTVCCLLAVCCVYGFGVVCAGVWICLCSCMRVNVLSTLGVFLHVSGWFDPGSVCCALQLNPLNHVLRAATSVAHNHIQA